MTDGIKISALNTHTTPGMSDIIPIVDMTGVSTKKLTLGSLFDISAQQTPGALTCNIHVLGVALGNVQMSGVGASGYFQQVAGSYFTGTMTGTFAPNSGQINQLIGIHLSMINQTVKTGANSAQDASRLRGIYGDFTVADGGSPGNGSVRCIHLTAIDITTGSSAFINGACFAVQPQKGAGRATQYARCLELDVYDSQTIGDDVSGIAQGIVFGNQSSTCKFDTGINMATYISGFTNQAILLKTGGVNGKIAWDGGAFILNDTGFILSSTNLLVQQQSNSGYGIAIKRYTDTLPDPASSFLVCYKNDGTPISEIDINGNIYAVGIVLGPGPGSPSSLVVTYGANDSGGAGYRILRVPNA